MLFVLRKQRDKVRLPLKGNGRVTRANIGSISQSLARLCTSCPVSCHLRTTAMAASRSCTLGARAMAASRSCTLREAAQRLTKGFNREAHEDDANELFKRNKEHQTKKQEAYLSQTNLSPTNLSPTNFILSLRLENTENRRSKFWRSGTYIIYGRCRIQAAVSLTIKGLVVPMKLPTKMSNPRTLLLPKKTWEINASFVKRCVKRLL